MLNPKDICFILVGPENPKNVGSAARAMNTMGFSRMRLVNPCDFLGGAARALAHKSQHILEQAEVFSSLEEAIADLDFVAATTARHRKSKRFYHPCRDLPQLIDSKKSTIGSVGVVFGPETSGLSNEDLDLCHCLTTIPTAAPQPSVNLAQAVMVYTYNLSQTSIQTSDWRIKTNKAMEGEYKNLWEQTEKLLEKLDASSDEKMRLHLKDAFARLSESDLYLVHNIKKWIEKKL